MRVLIFGAGAVGCYIGGHLALAGHDVTLLGREALVSAVTSRGLRLRLAAGEHTISTIGVASTLSQVLDLGGDFDWIAFTMKAYDTAPAIFDLQAAASKPPPIVSFQNGVGNEETLRSASGETPVIAGTLTTAVSMPEPGLVVEEKPRGLALATDSASWQLVAEALAATNLTSVEVPSTPSLKWSKLLLNILANATTAILDMPVSEILSNTQIFSVEREAFLEALAIMRLMNVEVSNLPGAPVRALALAMRWLPPPLLRAILADQIGGGRGGKMPSLHQALKRGQRRTEAAWLNGAVAAAADSLHRLAPVNHALALLVSDIAGGRVPWEMYRHNPAMLMTTIQVARGARRWRW